MSNKLTEEQVLEISAMISKRMQAYMSMGLQSNKHTLQRTLKKAGALSFYDEIQEQIEQAQKTSMTIALIQFNFDKKAIVRNKHDPDNLFPLTFNYDILTDKVKKKSEWKDMVKIFTKSFSRNIEAKIRNISKK